MIEFSCKEGSRKMAMLTSNKLKLQAIAIFMVSILEASRYSSIFIIAFCNWPGCKPYLKNL